MYYLITDETNLNESDRVKFFIYGGLIVGEDSLLNIHYRIEEIRDMFDFHNGDTLKFDTRARPHHVSRENYTNAKREVINCCLENDCKFIAYCIHHQVINKDEVRSKLCWAIDHVIGRFNYYLSENDEHGMCIIDNLQIDRPWQFLGEKFSYGLNIEGKEISLDKIVSYSQSTLQSSHLNSAVDIILGSFRYCVNEPENEEASKEMMKNLLELLWYQEVKGVRHYQGKGLIMRPKTVRREEYKRDYERLLHNLNEMANSK